MRKPLPIASGAALRDVTFVLAAALLLGAGLSQVAGEPDGDPFIGVANAASSFDEARGAKLFAANCAVCHQASVAKLPR